MIDFVVYYINIDEETFGGIYFGNHPGLVNGKGNKIETKKSMLLEEERMWDIYYRDDEFFTELIIDNINGTGWDMKIHLWIIGKTIADIENMLFYYSTMGKNNKNT
jgi:hypothetical protein